MLLWGMGWEKGKLIGWNFKIIVIVLEFVRRLGMLGFGVVLVLLKVIEKKYIKLGEI